MAEERRAKVLTCSFESTWNNPKGGLVFYHRLELSNGDVGSCGTVEKNPDKIKKGATITYFMDNGRIKLVNTYEAPMKSQIKKQPFYPMKRGKEEYLGYTWGYAKDLIIAGKTMKDFKELKTLAHAIYDEITAMLGEDEKNNNSDED